MVLPLGKTLQRFVKQLKLELLRMGREPTGYERLLHNHETSTKSCVVTKTCNFNTAEELRFRDCWQWVTGYQENKTESNRTG